MRRDGEHGRMMQRRQRLSFDAGGGGPIPGTQNNECTLQQKINAMARHRAMILDRRGVGEKGQPLVEVGGDV